MLILHVKLSHVHQLCEEAFMLHMKKYQLFTDWVLCREGSNNNFTCKHIYTCSPIARYIAKNLDFILIAIIHSLLGYQLKCVYKGNEGTMIDRCYWAIRDLKCMVMVWFQYNNNRGHPHKKGIKWLIWSMVFTSTPSGMLYSNLHLTPMLDSLSFFLIVLSSPYALIHNADASFITSSFSIKP